MMRTLLALALAAPVLAGCLGASDEALSTMPLPLLAHDASGPRPVPQAFADTSFSIHPTGYRRGEPTLGVTSDGTI
ncbi:MAG: hypothetical protein ACT4PT_12830, partial [Methanobacteriota archaeon]